MANEYSKIEGNGLLQNYQDQGDALEDALQRRRQKLASRKIGLSPQPDSDPDWEDTED
jgi:hypothetical protein